MKLTIIIIVIWILTISSIVSILKRQSEQDCTKSQTNAIEINGELKDYLICTSDKLPRIIKQY